MSDAYTRSLEDWQWDSSPMSDHTNALLHPALQTVSVCTVGGKPGVCPTLSGQATPAAVLKMRLCQKGSCACQKCARSLLGIALPPEEPSWHRNALVCPHSHLCQLHTTSKLPHTHHWKPGAIQTIVVFCCLRSENTLHTMYGSQCLTSAEGCTKMGAACFGRTGSPAQCQAFLPCATSMGRLAQVSFTSGVPFSCRQQGSS